MNRSNFTPPNKKSPGFHYLDSNVELLFCCPVCHRSVKCPVAVSNHFVILLKYIHASIYDDIGEHRVRIVRTGYCKE